MHRPYDASIQIRTHRTTLATIASFYKQRGSPPISTSALVRQALEDFKDAIVLQGHIEEVTSTIVAATILEDLDIKSGSRTDRQLLTNLQLDELKSEGLTPISKSDKLTGVQLPLPLTFQPEDDPTLDIIRTIPENLIAKEKNEDGRAKSKAKSNDKGED